jgi:hypothetical protein
VIIDQISLEQQNLVTDPLLNAWQNPNNHFEAADECRNDFLTAQMSGSAGASEETNAGTLSNQTYGGVDYYLNDAFNLAADKLSYSGVPCVAGIELKPAFTAPNQVKVGEVVGFDGMESGITLNEGTHYSNGTPEATYAKYTWTYRKTPAKSGEVTPETKIGEGFAPGAPACETPWLTPCAASEYYTFPAPGDYEVTLHVRDVGGNESSVTHGVEVSGSEGASEGSGGPGSPASAGSGSHSASSAAVPTPVARAAVVSHSLGEALNRGLAVLYSVNEQVAGHFEVLIPTKLAHSLGIAGTPASGLPSGSPPQTIIARALLVTLKGGSSAVHIKFSKETAKRLARLKKVALELRLIVHNSATHPASTLVTTLVTLGQPAKHHSSQ